MTRLFLIILFTILVACKKEDYPPVVYTYPVTDVTLRQASSGGYIEENGGSAIIRRGIIWSTSTKANLSNYEGIKEEGAGSGEFISQIAGLEPGKNYYARAFATNHTETGYGQEVTFTAGDGNIETDLVVGNISYFSVTANCIIHSYGGDSITERGFIWNSWVSYQLPTIDSHAGRVSKGAGNSSYSSELTGLSSYRRYQIRAYTINSLDTFYSKTVTFRTLAVEDGVPGEVIDIDGNVYPTITLGGIEWMAENLRTKRFNDGSPIPHVTTNHGWNHLDSPAWCWYENDETQYGQFYGALYNRYAALSDNLCPAGWRVPGFNELYHHLQSYLLKDYNILNFGEETEKLMGNVLKSCRQENSPLAGECETSSHPRWNANQWQYGTDFFGFSALPGGSRSANGTFFNVGERGLWWTTEGYSQGKAFSIRTTSGQFDIIDQASSNGLSVRCVRDVTE